MILIIIQVTFVKKWYSIERLQIFIRASKQNSSSRQEKLRP